MANNDNYWATHFKKRYSRRLFLGMAASVGASYAGLTLAGCSGGTAKPATSGTPAAKAPKYGGIFRFSNPGEFSDLDPYDVAGRLPQRAAMSVIYDWLVVFDWSGDLIAADGKIVPRLSESWTMPDEITYVFKIRQGVKWHDGTEFTSADVQFSYDFNLDRQNALPGRSTLEAVSRIEAPDKGTIKITLKRPSAAFLALLTDDALPIAPKHLLEKDRKGLATNPVGTGPFMLEKLDSKTGATLKRNPNYYVPGKPYLDGIVMVSITDWSVKAAAFMSKEIDTNIVPDKPQYEAMKAVVTDAQVRTYPGVTSQTIQFNYTRPPFNDVRVRRAVHLIIDRQAVMDKLWAGGGMINPPSIPGAWKKWAIPQDELLKMPGFRQPKGQDIAEAKRLLAEAGYANGLKVVILGNSEGGVASKVIEVIAEQFRGVGIAVEQQLLDRPSERKKAQAGDFEIDYTAQSGGVDPDNRLFTYVHSAGASNFGKLKDPKLDEMIEKQSSILNEQERATLVQEVQRYMIEQAYHVPVADPGYYGLMQPYVRGYDPAYMGVAHPHLRGEAEEIWLDK